MKTTRTEANGIIVRTNTTSYQPEVWYFFIFLYTMETISNSNRISDNSIGAIINTYPNKKRMEIVMIAKRAIKSEYSCSVTQSYIPESDEELNGLSIEIERVVFRPILATAFVISIDCSKSRVSVN